MKKRAMTPVISTILLLLFAVGLGTLVMSWGSSDAFLELGCEDTDLAITYIDEKPDLCMQNGDIVAVIENNGRSKISKIGIFALLLDGEIAKEYDIQIAPGEYKRVNFSIDGVDASKVLKIRLVPFIEDNICTDKRFEAEDLGEC